MATAYVSKGALSPQWLETLSYKELTIVQKRIIQIREDEAEAQEKAYREEERKIKRIG